MEAVQSRLVVLLHITKFKILSVQMSMAAALLLAIAVMFLFKLYLMLRFIRFLQVSPEAVPSV